MFILKFVQKLLRRLGAAIVRFLKRLLRIAMPVAEPALEGEPIATYSGIKKRIAFFMSMAMLTFFGFYPLHLYMIRNFPSMVYYIGYGDKNMAFSLLEYLFLILSYGMTYLRFCKGLAKSCGILYSLSTGYVLAFDILLLLLQPWKQVILMIPAFLILAILPFIIIRSLHLERHPYFGYLIMLLYALLKLWKPILSLLKNISGIGRLINKILSVQSMRYTEVILYIAGLLLCECFLILAVQRCRNYVKNNASKKYEWVAAFVQVFTMLDIAVLVVEFITECLPTDLTIISNLTLG